MSQQELKQQYREAQVGDFVKVPSKNSSIPLWAGEVWNVEEEEDAPKRVYFGDNGYYLMEHDGRIGVFRVEMEFFDE